MILGLVMLHLACRLVPFAMLPLPFCCFSSLLCEISQVSVFSLSMQYFCLPDTAQDRRPAIHRLQFVLPATDPFLPTLAVSPALHLPCTAGLGSPSLSGTHNKHYSQLHHHPLIILSASEPRHHLLLPLQ